jgi:hypothetical protein
MYGKQQLTNSVRNNWILVKSENVNKQPKEERDMLGPDSRGSLNGVTA